MAIPLLNVQFLEFFTRHEHIEHLEQRVRAQMLWQVKLREQFPKCETHILTCDTEGAQIEYL